MGGSAVQIMAAFGLSPAFAGFENLSSLDLGLTPEALCSRLLRRLKNRPYTKQVVPKGKELFSV
jgi:hypothetical protein